MGRLNHRCETHFGCLATHEGSYSRWVKTKIVIRAKQWDVGRCNDNYTPKLCQPSSQWILPRVSYSPVMALQYNSLSITDDATSEGYCSKGEHALTHHDTSSQMCLLKRSCAKGRHRIQKVLTVSHSCRAIKYLGTSSHSTKCFSNLPCTPNRHFLHNMWSWLLCILPLEAPDVFWGSWKQLRFFFFFFGWNMLESCKQTHSII